MNNKHISTDKPVTIEQEDKFQRYNFSQRIAKTILERDDVDCIVIGIYGAWGEGKTSVLNFIETELKKNEETIIVKFNPWRYNDENSLLTQFFNKLAIACNGKLKTKKENFGNLLAKYGKVINFDIPGIGNVGEAIQSTGEALKEVDIETLKTRISDIIKANGNNIIVFIDDIDRLDKNEIHSIFRLVKLTADFPCTTYILSFDEQMVSAAIGERFGEGNQNSGQNFLEKIIQVPLKIPVAQPEALQQFCYEQINKALDKNNINVDGDEAQRFANEFSKSLLPRLDTPRLSIRYSNTLSFSLPLLFGEVNIVDLMLLEAIKIFYPKYYEFIRVNPTFFIGTYSLGSQGKNNEKSKRLKDHLATLSEGLSRKHTESIQDLLKELFPILKEALDNYSFSNSSVSDWTKNKRIASPNYFKRYFTYAVIKGEISDVAFDNMVDAIPNQEEDQTIKAVTQLVTESSPGSFIQKIRGLEDEFSWAVSQKLAKAISKASNIFPKEERFLMGFDPYSQAVIFVYRLIKKHQNESEYFQFIQEIANEALSFEFVFDLYKRFKSEEKSSTPALQPDQYVKFGNDILDRAQKEAGDEHLFIKYRVQNIYLFSIWAIKDKKQLDEYIEQLFETDSSLCIQLLSSLTSTIRISSLPQPYQSNFTKDIYEFILPIFDQNLIVKDIFKNFTEDELNQGEINWDDHSGPYQSDMNICRQYLHWHKTASKTD